MTSVLSALKMNTDSYFGMLEDAFSSIVKKRSPEKLQSDAQRPPLLIRTK